MLTLKQKWTLITKAKPIVAKTEDHFKTDCYKYEMKNNLKQAVAELCQAQVKLG